MGAKVEVTGAGVSGTNGAGVGSMGAKVEVTGAGDGLTGAGVGSMGAAVRGVVLGAGVSGTKGRYRYGVYPAGEPAAFSTSTPGAPKL